MAEDEIKWEKLQLPEGLAPSQVEKEQLIRANISNKIFCVAKVENGWHAVQDSCPHAGASLSKGYMVKGQVVVCPLHRIKFDICTGKNITGEGYGMRSYPVKEEGNDLFIGMPDKNWYQFWK